MPRRRPRPPPHLEDRDLAAEVLYLHSLWRRGPPAPAPAPIPVPAAAPAANPSRSARRNANKRNRRRPERGGAAETEDAGSEWPLAPSPPASPDASASPAESAPPSPGSPAAEEAVSNSDPVRSGSSPRKANRRKRRKLDRYAAEAQGHVSQWPLAPSPSTSPKAWPDPASSPAKPPPPPPSPGSLAQREALRAAEEFFSKDGSDDEGSEPEGEEEEAAGFFTGMFERHAALRGHYERGWEEGQFACMACAGRKVRRGKGRRFRGCIGLVQHARDARLSGRRGAHRALAAIVCRVLGWDTERLPSIVMDRRGTLGQALAARAPSDIQEEKLISGACETDMKDANTNGDPVANELLTSKESAEMDNVEETGPLNCEDGSKNNILGHQANQEDAVTTRMDEPVSIAGEKEISELCGGKESSEKEDVETQMKDSSTDGIGAANELGNDEHSAAMEDEDTGPTNLKEISRNEMLCTETVQEVNANTDDSLSHGKYVQVYDQEIAKGSDGPEKTNDVHLLSPNETCKNEEHCKEVAVQGKKMLRINRSMMTP